MPDELGEVRDVVAMWIGRLGDFLIATPFLHALRQRFPDARITAVVAERGREAAELCPDVDRIATFRKSISPFANLPLLAELRRPHDLLVDLNSAFSRASTALAWAARARVKVAFERARGNGVFGRLVAAPAETEHMLERYRRLAEAIGAPYEPRLRVRVPDEASARGRELARRAFPAEAPKRVLIHPGNFKKFDNRWPEDKFVALTDRLLTERPGVAIAYLCGPGEEEPVRALTARIKRPVPVLPPMPLAELAGALSEADLLIVNATGTAHLAAALEVPTLTFLSRYTKTVWMPLDGPHYSVVSDSWDSCRDITVEAAWAALSSALHEPPRRLASEAR